MSLSIKKGNRGFIISRLFAQEEHIRGMPFVNLPKTACLPKEWKEANVTPVHKKDTEKPASNYRPFSLLCLINKALECCVAKTLYNHVKNVITPLQHEFRQKYSCISRAPANVQCQKTSVGKHSCPYL